MPMNSHVNPERECRAIGLEYDPAPPMATRSQLLETRKEGMRRECEELRTKCDGIQVPLSVRRTRKEIDELEFRRGGDHCMTHTKLKDRRRRDKIEYDMERFEHKAKTYPKFSDRPHLPFWVHEDKTPQEAPVLAAMPRTVSEPVFKIHEVPFGDDVKESHDTLPDAAYQTAAGLPAAPDMRVSADKKNKQAVGSRTKKSFCADMIERGQARNMPRLFDAIQPLHTGPRDMESLDVTSSLAPVRENAMKKNAEQRKRNAENPRRSMLWSNESSGMQQSASGPSQAAMGTDSGMMNTSMDGMNSIDVSRRSQERSSSISAPMRAAATRVHHVTSDPTLRSGNQTKHEAAPEPRFFGSMQRSLSDSTTGVRCGGFQRLDWPASHPRAAPAADQTRDKKRSDHRQDSRAPKAGKEHSTSTVSAQPL